MLVDMARTGLEIRRDRKDAGCVCICVCARALWEYELFSFSYIIKGNGHCKTKSTSAHHPSKIEGFWVLDQLSTLMYCRFFDGYRQP